MQITKMTIFTELISANQPTPPPLHTPYFFFLQNVKHWMLLVTIFQLKFWRSNLDTFSNYSTRGPSKLLPGSKLQCSMQASVKGPISVPKFTEFDNVKETRSSAVEPLSRHNAAPQERSGPESFGGENQVVEIREHFVLHEGCETDLQDEKIATNLTESNPTLRRPPLPDKQIFPKRQANWIAKWNACLEWLHWFAWPVWGASHVGLGTASRMLNAFWNDGGRGWWWECLQIWKSRSFTHVPNTQTRTQDFIFRDGCSDLLEYSFGEL